MSSPRAVPVTVQTESSLPLDGGRLELALSKVEGMGVNDAAFTEWSN